MHFKRLLFLFLLISFISFSQTTYKIDEKAIYSWDDTAMPEDWRQDFVHEFTYGNGGAKETIFLIRQFPSLQPLTRSLKTYNGNNDIILENRQFWNTGTSMWDNNGQVLYTYDGSDNLTEEVLQISTGPTTYQNFSRELYEYTGGNRTKQTSQTWSIFTNMWENDEKADISYTGSLPMQIVYSNWNGSSWEPYERDTVTYNVNDLPDEILEETYNMGAWETSSRSVYTYSGLLRTEVLDQNWNGSSWENEDRQLISYDTNDNPIELIFEEWDNVDSEWDGYYKEDRVFSIAGPLSAKSFAGTTIKVYPNPVSDVLNMEFTSPINSSTRIDVFGMEGSLLFSNKDNVNSDSFKVDLSSLSAGNYLLRLSDNGRQSQTFKILKK